MLQKTYMHHHLDQLMEMSAEYLTFVNSCFVDITKAYDSLDHKALLAIMELIIIHGYPISWWSSSRRYMLQSGTTAAFGVPKVRL